MLRVAALNRKLARLPRVAKEEIRKALAKSADEIVAFARSLVPVDDGDLRDSIGWTWKEPPRRSVLLGLAKAGDLTVTIFAGDDKAFYARWVEFGTKDGKPGATPFFYPAYRALRKRARSRVSRATTKAARKVAAG